MHQKLPKEIDALRFAHTGRELEGEIALSSMQRLATSLQSDDGTVKASMRFDIDHTGMPYLQGHFETSLSLICERCLQGFDYPVKINALLGLIRHEKLAETLDERYDPFILNESDYINIAELVEDELILNLPIVPKHDFDCLPKEALQSKDNKAAETVEDKVSPFAALASLKTKKD